MTAAPNQPVHIVPSANQADRAWLTNLWQAEWGGDVMVSHGQIYRLPDLHALIAWAGEQRVGAATYHLTGEACELMSLNATVAGLGAGEAAALAAGCSRVWLITSNDNLEALRFYQRRGYGLVAIHAGAVDAARQIKPSIPLVGYHVIPLHDEIELEKRL